MTPAEYDAWYDSPRGRWIGESEWRGICRHLDLTPGSTLLDVGCGTGWFSRRLASAGLQVTGLDIDAEALDFARAHSPQRIAYLAGDGRCLPFADRSFEQTVALASLCFIDDWPRAIGEIVRVTRSRFVLGLLNRHSLLWRSKGQDGGTGGYTGAHWHTRQEIAPVLTSLQVRGICMQTAVFMPSGTGMARLAERVLPSWLPWGAFLIVSASVPADWRS